MISRIVKNQPALCLCALTAPFYFYSTAHFAWWWAWLLPLPVLAFNYVLFSWGIKAFRRRLAKAELQVDWEIFSLVLLLFFLGGWILGQGRLVLLGLVSIFFLWLWLQAYLRRLGVFYIGFIGLLLFILASLSYYLLYLEWQFVIFVSQYYGH